MSDDAVTFLAIVCCAVAFTVGLFTWQSQPESIASAPIVPRVTQTESPKSSPRAGDIRDAAGTKG